jgi:MoaA/NifB/PqqE/SkfB family radical SAM enzyme
LREGKQCNVDHLSFTGGEPTLHPKFSEIVSRLCSADYTFSFVSNGSTFPHIYPLLLERRRWFRGVTFSLDGAHQRTHDRLRGEGSFRQVTRAASICVVKDLPFSFNMVLTSQNRHEVKEMIELAAGLGSRGVRFGHLMPTPETDLAGLDLSPAERRESESEIWKLQKGSPVPVGMAPGYYSSSPFFACGPLELEEFNLDYQGNLTLCCQLSGYSGPGRGSDFVGSLREMSLVEACDRFAQRVATYLAGKQARVNRGEFGELDHFPCWYCVKYLGKAQRLEAIAHHSWTHGQEDFERGVSNGHIGTTVTPQS